MIVYRDLTSADRPAITSFLKRIPEFAPDELPVAEEVLDDSLDVLVGQWGLFIKQVAFFTNDAAAQRRLRECIDAEPFTSPAARFAARPFAARAVGQ